MLWKWILGPSDDRSLFCPSWDISCPPKSKRQTRSNFWVFLPLLPDVNLHLRIKGVMHGRKAVGEWKNSTQVLKNLNKWLLMTQNGAKESNLKFRLFRPSSAFACFFLTSDFRCSGKTSWRSFDASFPLLRTKLRSYLVVFSSFASSIPSCQTTLPLEVFIKNKLSEH